MNKIVEDLATQAKFLAEEEINRKISYNAELKAFALKLTELIIKDCTRIVNSLEQHEGPGDSSTAEYIKEHFGIL